VAVGELLLEVANIGPELVDLGGQGKGECPHRGGHLSGQFGRDAAIGSSGHAASVTEIPRPYQTNCASDEHYDSPPWVWCRDGSGRMIWESP
jgi:hypothetical protein